MQTRKFKQLKTKFSKPSSKMKQTEIGMIPEKYYFFLNPYPHRIFTKCPKCDNKTNQKKLPITIEIEKKKMFLNINKTCRFCERCELLIVKKQEIEDILLAAFGEKISEKEYYIIGTIDEAFYCEGISNIKDSKFLEHFCLFKEKWNFEEMPRYVWVADKK